MNRFTHIAIASVIGLSAACASAATPGSNQKLVLKAMTELFVKRDVSAVGRYWSKNYTQHNPEIPNGSEELPEVVKKLPESFKYEPGLVAGSGNIVMIQGRYTGWGPKPLIIVDIFRVKGGKLVEHWDVAQEEVPAGKTKSGNPMFTPRAQ